MPSGLIAFEIGDFDKWVSDGKQKRDLLQARRKNLLEEVSQIDKRLKVLEHVSDWNGNGATAAAAGKKPSDSPRTFNVDRVIQLREEGVAWSFIEQELGQPTWRMRRAIKQLQSEGEKKVRGSNTGMAEAARNFITEFTAVHKKGVSVAAIRHHLKTLKIGSSNLTQDLRRMARIGVLTKTGTGLSSLYSIRD